MILRGLQRSFVSFLFMLSCAVGILPASSIEQVQQEPTSEEDSKTARRQDEIRDEPGTTTASPNSLADGYLRTMRDRWGFSLGLGQFYTSDLTISTKEKEAATFTSLQSRIFAKPIQSSRSELWLNYGLGYRAYNRGKEPNNFEHSGTASLNYRLSTKNSIHVSDVFSSVFNEDGFSDNSLTPAPYEPDFAQQIHLGRERLTTNSLVVGLERRLSRRSNIDVFSNYEFWRNGNTKLRDTHSVQTGMAIQYQIKKWLILNSAYTDYLTTVNDASGESSVSIHRLRVGELRFRFRRTVELSFGPEVESTRHMGIWRTAAGFQSVVSKKSESTWLSLLYHRGFSTAVGPGAIFDGDYVTALFNRWLSRRINFQLSSIYIRGSSFEDSSLRYITARAGLGIAVQDHTLVSVHYSYLSQHTTNLPVNALNVSRYTVATALQYSLPSLRQRQR